MTPVEAQDAGNLLDDDGVGDVIEAGAAFGFGKGHAGEAEFGGLAKGFAGEMSGLVDFASERFYFGFGELAHGFLQELLFFGEFEIHDCSLVQRRLR